MAFGQHRGSSARCSGALCSAFALLASLTKLVLVLLEKLLGEVGEVVAVVEEKLLSGLDITERSKLETELMIHVHDFGRDIAAFLVVLRCMVDIPTQVAVDGGVHESAVLWSEPGDTPAGEWLPFGDEAAMAAGPGKAVRLPPLQDSTLDTPPSHTSSLHHTSSAFLIIMDHHYDRNYENNHDYCDDDVMTYIYPAVGTQGYLEAARSIDESAASPLYLGPRRCHPRVVETSQSGRPDIFARHKRERTVEEADDED